MVLVFSFSLSFCSSSRCALRSPSTVRPWSFGLQVSRALLICLSLGGLFLAYFFFWLLGAIWVACFWGCLGGFGLLCQSLPSLWLGNLRLWVWWLGVQVVLLLGAVLLRRTFWGRILGSIWWCVCFGLWLFLARRRRVCILLLGFWIFLCLCICLALRLLWWLLANRCHLRIHTDLLRGV